MHRQSLVQSALYGNPENDLFILHESRNLERMEMTASVRPPTAPLEVSGDVQPDFHNRYVQDTLILTQDRFAAYEQMDCNLDRPVHGLDLQSVVSDPNVTINDAHVTLSPMGPQNTTVVMAEMFSLSAGGRTPLPDKFVATPKNVQNTIASIKNILLDCYPFINLTVVDAAVGTLINTLETEAGSKVELIEVEISEKADAEVKMERNDQGKRSNSRSITLRYIRYFGQN